MTREDAIEWMQEEKASFERAPDLNGCPMTEYWQKAIDVYDMAISALRQPDVTDKDVGKMTNAQKIRAMSDEELVKFLYNYKFVDMCEEGCNLCHYHGNCESRLADWLQKPAEEDDHA